MADIMFPSSQCDDIIIIIRPAFTARYYVMMLDITIYLIMQTFMYYSPML